MNNSLQKILSLKKIAISLIGLVFLLSADSLFAAASTDTIGGMASNITASFGSLASLITGGCYLAGLAFAVTAIMKFKQHKDNPTQITIGTPISLVFIAAALLFMPSILDIAGNTMFGVSKAELAGPSGYGGQYPK